MTLQQLELNKITITNVISGTGKSSDIKKISASDSVILRGTYDGKSIYIKLFSQENGKLKYEMSIYDHINSAIEKNNYLESSFVIALGFIRCKGSEMKAKINNETKKELSDKLLLTDDNIFGLITLDSGTETLSEYLSRMITIFNTKTVESNKSESLATKTNTLTNITSCIFESCYSLYLLQNKLQIYHNDNHFNNMIVNVVEKAQERTYLIGNKLYRRSSKINVRIFDYDNSYLVGHANPSLTDPICDSTQYCNLQTLKANFVYITSLFHKLKDMNDLSFKEFMTFTNYMIYSILLNKNDNLYEALEDHYFKKFNKKTTKKDDSINHSADKSTAVGTALSTAVSTAVSTGNPFAKVKNGGSDKHIDFQYLFICNLGKNSFDYTKCKIKDTFGNLEKSSTSTSEYSFLSFEKILERMIADSITLHLSITLDPKYKKKYMKIYQSKLDYYGSKLKELPKF